MDQILNALVTLLVGIITALGALVIAAVPRIWQWLGARIHGENVLLLRQTIENAAALAVRTVRSDGKPTEAAIDAMVDYVRDTALPKTVRKLKLSNEQLRQMCVAAFWRVANGMPPP